MRREDLLLYAVTDRSWLGERTLAEKVEQCLKGGATLVQLREKRLPEEKFLKEALELKALCARYGVPIIINDNVSLALRAGADGVHVGQSDMEAGRVREALGPDKIIGVSCKTVEQALLAERQGADYLGVGAMYATDTKSDTSVVSRETLKAICEAVSIPVVAIGGLKLHNLSILQGTGAAGAAVVSALFAKEDAEAAARELKEALTQILVCA